MDDRARALAAASATLAAAKSAATQVGSEDDPYSDRYIDPMKFLTDRSVDDHLADSVVLALDLIKDEDEAVKMLRIMRKHFPDDFGTLSRCCEEVSLDDDEDEDEEAKKRDVQRDEARDARADHISAQS